MEDFEKYDIRRLSMRQIRQLKTELKAEAWNEKYPNGYFTLVVYTHGWRRLRLSRAEKLAGKKSAYDYPIAAKRGSVPFHCPRYHLVWTYFDRHRKSRGGIGVRSKHTNLPDSRPPDTTLISYSGKGYRRTARSLANYLSLLHREKVPAALITKFLNLPEITSIEEKNKHA